MVQYTDKQKIAYYKRKAEGGSARSYSRPSYSRPYTGYGSYKRKAPYKKSYKKSYKPSYGRQASAVGSALGGLAGTALGGPAGSIIGSALGNVAGYGLANIMGYGQYKVKKNIFMDGRLPQVVNVPKAGGVVLRFQEYLGDIYTNPDISDPGAFSLQSYLVNAANADTFPWLNQIAANYEQYSFEGLLFQFRSTSGDALNSTNTALGSVMMATQYDVADPVFSSKAEMLNYEYSNSIKPSENCMHMVECAPNQNVLSDLYTLDGSAPANTDSRLYHLGRFCIATVGFQAAGVNIGELHVTYQVRLLKPKLYASLGNLADFALLINTTGTPYTNAQPIPASMTLAPTSNFEVTSLSSTITIPASAIIKTYRIEIFWIGTGAVVLAQPSLTLFNCVGNSAGESPTTGSTAPNAAQYFCITTKGNSSPCGFSFSNGTLPTSPASAYNTIIRIMQVPQNAKF